MDTNSVNATRVTKEPSPDLLRRIFVPVERRNVDGFLTFTTIDGHEYKRDPSGAIRSLRPDVHRSKKERVKARAQQLRFSTQRQQEVRRTVVPDNDKTHTSDPRPDKSGREDKYIDPPSNSKTFPAPGGIGNDSEGKSDEPKDAPKDGK